jgi:hypothetical protein
VKCYIWSIAVYGDETLTSGEYLESLEMWCWRRIEKISWTNRVKNEVLQRAKEVRNILHAIKRRKANWIGHILSCILKDFTEGKLEEMGKMRRHT